VTDTEALRAAEAKERKRVHRLVRRTKARHAKRVAADPAAAAAEAEAMRQRIMEALAEMTAM
jgi:hypothetical protein